MPDTQFLSVNAAARHLGLSRRSVERRIKRGTLASILRDGRRLIRLEVDVGVDAAAAVGGVGKTTDFPMVVATTMTVVRQSILDARCEAIDARRSSRRAWRWFSGVAVAGCVAAIIGVSAGVSRLATADAQAEYLGRVSAQLDAARLHGLRARETAQTRLDVVESERDRLSGELAAMRKAQRADRWAALARGAMDALASAGSAQGTSGERLARGDGDDVP